MLPADASTVLSPQLAQRCESTRCSAIQERMTTSPALADAGEAGFKELAAPFVRLLFLPIRKFSDTNEDLRVPL